MSVIDELAPRPAPLRMDENGAIRVGTTRVTLDTVISSFQNGCSAEEIAMKYPTLALGDIYAVIAYYLWHKARIDDYLAERKVQADELRDQIDREFPSYGIRERLLARRGTPA
ncbi:MAG TPA: DUF433 domain-containing protein [Armatimonadota bacterium]|nr:DUF433 domain-containing protein [Armatimonadota bacterium]